MRFGNSKKMSLFVRAPLELYSVSLWLVWLAIKSFGSLSLSLLTAKDLDLASERISTKFTYHTKPTKASFQLKL